jgi:hypothetical protein
MSDNLAIWNKLGKTDPAQTKAFSRAGGFRGTATRPVYLDMKMTETFGPCGTGWGMGKPDFTLVDAGAEKLVFCTVELWYEQDGRKGCVWGVGGDKVVAGRKDGAAFTDDEAFKKAYTDAVGNAMKYLGMSADVHMGKFEDSKYVRELQQEFAEEPTPPKTPAREAVRQQLTDSQKLEGMIEFIDKLAAPEKYHGLVSSSKWDEFAAWCPTDQWGRVQERLELARKRLNIKGQAVMA